MIVLPGIAGPSCHLAIARSALRSSGAFTVEVLLVGSGSGVSLATVAVLVTEPLAEASSSTATVTVMGVALAPAARLARLQRTVGAVSTHDHPLPVAEIRVRPAGIESATSTDSADPGPALATCSV